MPDPFAIPDTVNIPDPLSGYTQRKPKSALLSILDTFDKPGEVVRNILSGNIEGAGRQLIDLLSSIPRALIPGDQSDWELARPQDTVHGADLLGINRQDHPIGAVAADIPLDIATDPLTYLSFGASVPLKAAARAAATAAEAGNAATKGAEAVNIAKRVANLSAEGADVAANAAESGGVGLRIPFTGIESPKILQGYNVDPLSLVGAGLSKATTYLPQGAQDAIGTGVLKTKSALGWLKGGDSLDATLAQSQGVRSQTAGAQATQVREVLKDIPQQALEDAMALRNNADKGADGLYHQLGPQAPNAFSTAEEQAGLHSQRAEMAGWTPERQAAAVDAANKYDQLSRSMWTEGVKDQKIFNHPPELDPELYAPSDYVPRKYIGQPDTPDLEVASMGSALKERIPAGQEYADYLNSSGAKPVMDAKQLWLSRANQQGSLAQKAYIGNALGGADFKALADPNSLAMVKGAIQDMKATNPEGHILADTAFNGMAPQTGLMGAIAKSNRYFKQSAVAGAVGMKVSSITRNALGHIPQVAMTPEAGGFQQATKQLAATPSTWWHGVKSGLEKYLGRQLPGDEVSKSIQQLRDAMAQAGGRRSQALSLLEQQGRPDLADALRNNVIDSGFVGADESPDLLREALVKGAAKVGIGEDRAREFLSAPGAGFSGSENYARLKTFGDLLENGKTAEQAAAGQRGAFYNYGVGSPEERAFRTLVPFGAFTAGATKQQALGLSRNPWMADVLNPLFGQADTGPVPPFVQEQMRLPLGSGPDGHDHYVSGLAQPVETLNEIPNLTGGSLPDVSRDLERGLISSSSPVIKSAYGLVTGKDPYFDTPFGSYDRIPAIGNAGIAGRVYNAAAGTGFIQPIDALLRLIDKPLDDRHSIPERALEGLTGAHILDVDPQQAAIQQMRQDLAGDINAHQIGNFTSSDPETIKLIKEYMAAKKQEALKKKVGAAGLPGP